MLIPAILYMHPSAEVSRTTDEFDAIFGNDGCERTYRAWMNRLRKKCRSAAEATTCCVHVILNSDDSVGL